MLKNYVNDESWKQRLYIKMAIAYFYLQKENDKASKFHMDKFLYFEESASF